VGVGVGVGVGVCVCERESHGIALWHGMITWYSSRFKNNYLAEM